MTGLRRLLWVVLVGFAVLTGDVLWQFGYVGFVDWALHNLATTLLFVDLVIALTILTSIIVPHARARDVSPWPYVALTCAFGVAGPLLYFYFARHADASPVGQPEAVGR